MIEIEFGKGKYMRTYIGGSKRAELELFKKVQGTKEDNSECDWLEYRRMLITYLKDVVSVLQSWKSYCQTESYLFLFLAALFIKSQSTFFTFMGFAVLFQIAYLIFRKKEKKKLKEYEICEDMCLQEIEKSTGFVLDKTLDKI